MVHEIAVSTWAEPAHNGLFHMLLLRNTYFWCVNVTQNCVHRWNRIFLVPAHPPSQQKTRHRRPGLASLLYQQHNVYFKMQKALRHKLFGSRGSQECHKKASTYRVLLQEALGRAPLGTRASLSKRWVWPKIQARLLFIWYDCSIWTPLEPNINYLWHADCKGHCNCCLCPERVCFIILHPRASKK